MPTKLPTAADAAPGFAVRAGWLAAIGAAVAVRLWNVWNGPLMAGYDAPGHLAYVFYLDRHHAVPWAHQGWGYFHPPLHYLVGWALAQSGSPAVLLRGLALVGSAASLAIAGLAAAATRAVAPRPSPLPLLAFSAVAFLPVHLYTSPMSGNELTCALFGCAALVVLMRNESAATPALAPAAAAGALVGLSLLAKFSGAVYLAAAAAAPALRPLWDRDADAARRARLRAAALVAVAGVLAGPYYLRNLGAYGTPFRMNRDYALTADVEARQPPGSRSWRDFVTLPPRLLLDPRPGAEHMLHSVWGTAYVNAWVDARAIWNRGPAADRERVRRSRVLMVWLGLLPTGLALLGGALAARDACRGRRVAVYLPLLLVSAAALLAFGAFAVRVPRVSALKASYLLALSLPYGVFAARGLEAFGRGRRAGVVAALAVALPAAASAVVYSAGAVLPRRGDAGATAAVHYWMGDYAAARRLYAAKLARAPDARAWIEGLAAVELADGRAERAATLYQRARALAPDDPALLARLGAAQALAGDPDAAAASLDAALAGGAGPDARANRGALLASRGDLAAAEVALRRAVDAAPDLAPAWHNLAAVLRRTRRPGDADAALAAYRAAAAAPPGDTPWDVGDGLLEPGRHPLLWLDGEALRLARAPYAEAP